MLLEVQSVYVIVLQYRSGLVFYIHTRLNCVCVWGGGGVGGMCAKWSSGMGVFRGAVSVHMLVQLGKRVCYESQCR